MDHALQFGYGLLDQGLIPDFALRIAIRALLRQRLREIDHGSYEANHAAKMNWIARSRARSTIADVPEKANEQHYEVSTEFILSCLGPYAKYSSCLYPTGKESLEEAEVLMMESYCKQAKLKDGQYVLDLGCGWGSLSLYLAQKYPQSHIIGLSNSATQKLYIDAQAKKRGLQNVKIITADVNNIDFLDCEPFDRILSIEMFEHMKNYELLLRKVSTWLRPSARPEDEDPDPALLFVHIFCHKTTPYDFEDDGSWMAQTFFSGGTMPSHDLLLYYQNDLALVNASYLPGTHYAHTLEDWLKRQDANAAAGLRELERDAAKKGQSGEGRKAFFRFRVFFMACAELFAFNDGQEWGVGHYLFKRKD
ncbi:S-adenosyl-L-methionine-dependent methyltransferase [Dentipellis sp. KUC8613]|nr:S-adenosyl-L-methionine-dependent methyltransferase [Dentipellis sp. KUC8613]